MSDRLTRLLELHQAAPTETFVLFALAKEYEGMGNFDQALHYYLQLQDTDAGYVGLYYHLGKLYEHLDRREDALAAYVRGMDAARSASDDHSLRELQAAHLEAEMD